MTDDIFAAMAAQLADVSVEEEDLTQASSITLADELDKIDRQLTDRKELLNPTTHEARELHSRRGAIIVTLKKRGAL